MSDTCGRAAAERCGRAAAERWKPVVGYEGLYEVSDLGRVKRVARGPSTRPGLVLKPAFTSRGYLSVELWRDREGTQRVIHRLVAAAFLANPQGKRTVNHKNGVKTDNRLTNLEWATHQENNIHARKVLRQGCGERHGSARLTEGNVRDIRRRYAQGGVRQVDLAAEFGVSDAMISRIVKRHNWKRVTEGA